MIATQRRTQKSRMLKSSKAEKRPTDFENLVRNGLEFLEKAISQLDSDPKHSVINFYTAVEIFLKAPLVHEHWTLVTLDRDFNRQKYEAGDFQSVSFEDACTRLATALNKQLKSSAKDAFDKVRKHRNRMVHFYHDGIDGRQRDEIKLEQAQAWFELNRFVVDTWRDRFEPFLPEFRGMERTLIAHNHYAQAKFESLKPRIDGLTKKGKTFQVCPSCGTAACEFEEPAEGLSSYDCLVCFFQERNAGVDCPECGKADQLVRAYEGLACEHCEHTVASDDAFELLDQNTTRGTKDGFDSKTPANCDDCQGYHTVCEYQGGYLCSNCLGYFKSVGQCEYCSDYMTGDTEGTYASGCEHCDGAASRYRDD